MKTVVGVFKSRTSAEATARELASLNISRDKINFLTPEVSDKELVDVPVVGGEQPGMGKAMGAAVGGTIGVAGGTGLVPLIASFLVPGLGPVLGIGIVAGTLLGAIGAVGGAAVGEALENDIFEGLPEDELFVYEDALRKGRTVLVVMTEPNKSNEVHAALERGGAETIDKAREMWWIGLRDAVKEKYQAGGGTFPEDERYFRLGFESALHSRNRQRSLEECEYELGMGNASAAERKAFKQGFERGCEYAQINRQNAA